MLKLREGKIVNYIGMYENSCVAMVRVEEDNDTRRFYVNLKNWKCGRTALWYIPKCTMDCFLDSKGTLYYNEKEAIFYKQEGTVKDYFILDNRNVAYSTLNGSSIYLRAFDYNMIRYNVDTTTEELIDYADLKEYGYYVKGTAKKGSKFFLCEIEEPQFYA